ncbi:Putative mannose-1-phosphate guanyltransferase [Candidatus Koribacter versatilis Ellin345]|uniref:Mannose-1-phosphate guanyltransferase n=1 Tax=Koribacter versatilis (strain Ellin345) TaxID=204669 RepID=Q1IHP0_KORVE|nr:mannose-1-phosphate guanylyltransferase [Candidatus Koribacter versatilis]ABF43610.1 Putative mannose-1-phosphate guanyltransferase [Candidatus Koribacter versatilis Ellin345]
MDVRAILVVGNTAPANTKAPRTESFAGLPLALYDVLGKSVLARTVQRLQHFGITQFTTVCDEKTGGALDARVKQEWNVVVEDHGLWRSAESVFNDFVQQGAELVLVLRIGAYAELDYEEFVQFHLEQHGRATVAVDARGYRIGIVALSASRRNDAAYLFRHNMEEFRVPCVQYQFRGYLNRLITPADLRQLSVDALLQNNHIQPIGREIRPGVWAGPRARIHPRARIVAPAYIGERAKLRASAVITRFTCIEHHAVVDCGTVLENTSIAPYTYVGAGLDINYAIVGRNRIASLRRNVEVEIKDPRLLSTLATSAPVRALREMGALAAYLPQQLFRGMFSRSQRTMPTDIPAAVNTPSAALKEPALTNPGGSINSTPEFPSELVVVRRYGNE